ncbi:iron-containing alcohol dehydrogenase [Xylophilus sp. Kf1]|nr:iron-containing alcohol dehydrogenase [Xylophilus sp. Kf1]
MRFDDPRHDFVSSVPGLRIHAGRDALARLGPELARLGCRRPLLLCGASVAASGLPARIAASLGAASVATFAGLGREAPLDAVQQAVRAAREAGADGLVAVGAGSTLRAARVVAILLAEDRPVAELVTRYPAHGPAVSARLAAPKLPIVNVLTAATTAQNRGGSALVAEGWTHRLEFFDPKTRPRAIFWDADALMTAPDRLVRDSGAMVWWRALMSLATVGQANPLVQASRHQAWALACSAKAGLATDDGLRCAGHRIDLCAAALLQNRDEDDGGAPMQAHRAARLVYALAAALVVGVPGVRQAAAYAALTTAALEADDEAAPQVRAGLAVALGLPATADAGAVHAAVRDGLAAWGQPVRLRDLLPDAGPLPGVAEFAQKSFNADRGREFQRHPQWLAEVLQRAW